MDSGVSDLKGMDIWEGQRYDYLAVWVIENHEVESCEVPEAVHSSDGF